MKKKSVYETGMGSRKGYVSKFQMMRAEQILIRIIKQKKRILFLIRVQKI